MELLKNKYVIIAIIVVVILLYLNRDKMSSETKTTQSTSGKRGIRNNNVGNIKISSSAWKGKIPVDKNTDGTFEQFEEKKWGDRALLKLLNTYYDKYMLRSIEKIITKYAPSTENKTAAYIDFVAKRTGISPTATLNIKDKNVLYKLAEAIAYFENGEKCLTQAEFDTAYKLM